MNDFDDMYMLNPIGIGLQYLRAYPWFGDGLSALTCLAAGPFAVWLNHPEETATLRGFISSSIVHGMKVLSGIGLGTMMAHGMDKLRGAAGEGITGTIVGAVQVVTPPKFNAHSKPEANGG